MSTEKHHELVEIVNEEVRKLAIELMLKNGIPMHVVLAAMHAHTIGAIAETYGGPMAAMAARQAAERVENLPSRKAYEKIVALATVGPAGRA
ncbi:hypothetical protein ACFQ3C_01510 [Seohaeicola saemankumensis]|uniref:Uncharacterized protein n=1 Tax=Seohaeicola saemankumensis TaxID=481181 RepID=A0ABW3TAS8_9RHOB